MARYVACKRSARRSERCRHMRLPRRRVCALGKGGLPARYRHNHEPNVREGRFAVRACMNTTPSELEGREISGGGRVQRHNRSPPYGVRPGAAMLSTNRACRDGGI